MSIFIVWFVLCLAIGAWASNKGRSSVAWFFCAFLLSPLLAGVFLALSRDLVAENAARASAQAEADAQAEWEANSRMCPRCAERVKLAALVCRYCGYEFEDQPVELTGPIEPAAPKMRDPTMAALDRIRDDGREARRQGRE